MGSNLRGDRGQYFTPRRAVDLVVRILDPKPLEKVVELPVRKDLLRSVTKKIFHAGREFRNWVDSPEFGIPYLRSSDLRKADLSDIPLLSKRHVEKNPALIVGTGYTLISRTGSIAYCRPEMDGMACSGDVLRVVPDPTKIPPGYLYAFLRSKFGIPLFLAGAYGLRIPYVGAELISDISIPRLDDDLEHEIHELVEEAGNLRTKATIVFRSALAELQQLEGLVGCVAEPQAMPPYCSVRSDKLEGRLDANFHSRMHCTGFQLAQHANSGFAKIGSVVSRVFETAPTKHSESEALHPFVTALQSPDILFIPVSGQSNRISGNPLIQIGGVRTGGISGRAIGVCCKEETDAGLVFLSLCLPFGQAQLKARAFVRAAPTLDAWNVSEILIPDLPKETRTKIGARGCEVAKLRAIAIDKEMLAIELLGKALGVN